MNRFSSLITIALLLLFFVPAVAFAEDGPENNAWNDAGLLLFENEERGLQFFIDGRIFLDAAYYNSEGAAPMADGAELRRGRFAFKAILFNDWAAEFDIDVADKELDVKDMWVSYIGWENANLQFGQHKPPYSMEELTSSRYIWFLERSLPNLFEPGRRIGISYTKWGESWQFSGGLYGQEIGDEDGVDEDFIGADESTSYAARFSWSPVHTDNRMFHVGLGYFNVEPDADSKDRYRFRGRSETHVSRARFLNTGKMKDVDGASALSFEVAGALGPFAFQAEVMKTDVSRYDGRADAEFDGYYAQASYFLTGQSRAGAYTVQDGEFASPILDDITGWEVVAVSPTSTSTMLSRTSKAAKAQTTRWV